MYVFVTVHAATTEPNYLADWNGLRVLEWNDVLNIR